MWSFMMSGPSATPGNSRPSIHPKGNPSREDRGIELLALCLPVANPTVLHAERQSRAQPQSNRHSKQNVVSQIQGCQPIGGALSIPVRSWQPSPRAGRFCVSRESKESLRKGIKLMLPLATLRSPFGSQFSCKSCSTFLGGDWHRSSPASVFAGTL